MKPLLICFSLFLFITFRSYSQNAVSKSNLSVSIGPSLPIGNFGSSDFSNDKAGFAGFGGNANISYSRLLGKHFGFAATVMGQLNPLNIHNMEKSFANQEIPDQSFSTSTGQPSSPTPTTYTKYSNWSFDKKSWEFASALVGAYGEFAIDRSGKTSIIAKAMAGVIYVSSPQLKGQGFTDTSGIFLQQSHATAYGFAYQLSVGIKHQLSKKFYLLADLGYLGTNNITFKNVTETEIIGKYPVIPNVYNPSNYETISAYTNISNVHQQIASLNLNVGVGIRL